MRKVRAIRLVIRLFLLVLTLSLSLVSFLGGLSAVMILSDEGNVAIPDGTPSGNLTLYDPSTGFTYLDYGHLEFDLPFNITNAGYFTLEELKVRISIGFIYDAIDVPVIGVNTTTFLHIFDRTIDFDPTGTGLASGANLKSSFSANHNETDDGGFQNLNDLPPNIIDIDQIFNPPSLDVNISLTCKYSVGLLSLRVDLYSLDLLTAIGGF